MTREEYILQVKTIIFGQPPACPLALIGHNMAVTYFTPLIWEAEKILQTKGRPPGYLITQMEKAFSFPSYGALQTLPVESMAALKKCTENFKSRYAPVMENFRPSPLLRRRKRLPLRTSLARECAKIERKIKGV